MNLKGFKKVQEDEHKAVLQNKQGHAFTIAKKSLSSKHLDSLKELSLHAADGAVIDDEQPDAAPQPDPAMHDSLQGYKEQEESAPVDNAPQRGLAANINNPKAPEQAQQPAPAPMQPEQQAPPEQPQQMQAAQAYQKSYNDYDAEHAKDFAQEDAAYAHDLRNGHIKPETYNSLFAKKDTVGKIGTLFGLLVSGAGAGLSHQPNAVLGMMQQEIQNDINAQNKSKDNAQNFLRINQANELNKAQIARTGEETKLLKSQTTGSNIENDIKALNKTKSQMMLSVLHDLQLGSDKIPANSPLKGPYMQSLNGVSQAATQDIQQSNAKAAAQLAGLTQAQYEAKSNKLRTSQMLGLDGGQMMAQDRESKELPGVGYSNTPLNDKDRTTATSIKNFQNLLGEYEGLVDKVGPRGNIKALTPSEKARATSIRNDLISSYNDVKGLTRFTGNEEELYKNIVPDIGKVNLTGSQRELLNRLKDSVAEKKKLEYERMGIHPFSDSQDNQQTMKAKSPKVSSVPEGATGTHNGKPVVFKGGKWSYR